MTTLTIQQQISATVHRTDPTFTDAGTSLAAAGSPFVMQRQLVLAQWRADHPDPQTETAMTAVLDRWFEDAIAAGITDTQDLDDISAAFVDRAPTLASWHLRKNTVMAAHNALTMLGVTYQLSGLHGHRPPAALIEEPADGAKPVARPRNRVATSDEVLLARVSAPLDCIGALHRRSAALAIATSGAATAEGAQVRWADHTPGSTSDQGTLNLSGRHLHDPHSGWHIAPRTVVLDAWADAALTQWRTEAANGARPLQTDWSMLYDGRQPLTSQSAKNSYDHHINLTLETADLAWIPGLTSMALAEWAAAHATLHAPRGLDAGAAVMGTDQTICLRRLTRGTSPTARPDRPSRAA
ncbi:hypothetical protein [Pedococcus soli]